MAPVRPRPWQVFLALWIPMGVFWWWLVFNDDPRARRTMDDIAKGQLVKARVVSGRLDSNPRGPASTATVRLEIPRTYGITTCESTLTRREFDELWGGEVLVNVTGPPVPRCYTGTAYRMIEEGTLSGPILGPMLFGAMFAWLLYYPWIRMEWSSKGSLKSRWDAERAAERGASAPPARP